MADSKLGGKRVPIVDPIAHFWAHVDQSGGPDACWPWTLSVVPTTGYGQYNNVKAGRHSAHVYAYIVTNGPVPVGLFLDHTCHNGDMSCLGGKECLHRRCCNPAHLEAITNTENLRRANAPRGRGNQKTHCAHDHLYDEANTMWIKKIRNGKTYNTRMCRTCNRERARARKVAG